jgi:hypothetical protein
MIRVLLNARLRFRHSIRWWPPLSTPLPRGTWKWCLRVADSAPARLSAGCARAGDNAALR